MDVLSFVLGIAASILANLLYEQFPRLFCSKDRRWAGQWIGYAEDIIIEGENDLDRAGLRQKIELRLSYVAKSRIKIKGTVFVLDNNDEPYPDTKSKIVGEGKIHNGHYLIFSYRLILEKSFGFGTGLVKLSPRGQKADGYFLSRRISNSINGRASRAFGKVSLDYNKGRKKQNGRDLPL